MVLVLLTYLSLPTIGVISLEKLRMGVVGGACLLGYGVVILLQVLVGILYGKQLFLKFQFSVYRNVVYYLGVFSIATDPQFNLSLCLLVLLSMCMVILTSLAIGKESYSKNLLK